MLNLSRFVGLDYHQDSIQVCVRNDQGTVLLNRRVENSVSDVVDCVEDTAETKSLSVKLTLESCSGAAHLADELITQTGWSVTLAHLGIVNRMKQNPDKTDKADAFILADLLRLNYLPKVWLAPEQIRQLRSLVRFRASKVKEQTRVKLRLRGLLRELRLKPLEGVRAWTKAWHQWLTSLPLDETRAFLRDEYLRELEHLKHKICEVEQRLMRQVADDLIVKKLISIEGIGLITAVTMRAEIANFDRFDTGKQLSRYAGVTPRNASSGQKQADAGLVRAGNPGLRVVLIPSAWRLINHSGRWRRFAQTMRQKGKAGNVIVAAVANRWLRGLSHEMQPEKLMGL